MNLINLLTPENIKSGIGETLFLAPVSFFSSIKKPAAPFLYPGAEVVIFDTHEFNEGLCFLQLLLPPNKNNVDAKTIGDLGFLKLQQDLKAMLAGSYAEQHEFIKNILNVPLIALVKDSNCSAGFFYQVGSECEPAYLSTDYSTGTTASGNKGYNVTISATNAFVQIYTGNLLLDGAVVLQAEDGDILITEDGHPIETE